MRAVLFDGSPGVKIVERAVPATAPGEVLLKGVAGGICGSDVFRTSGKDPRARPPLVIGHEVVASVVEDARRGEPGLAEGTRVVLYPVIGCGTCRFCTSGKENLCDSVRIIGAQVDGGFADYFKVPSSNVFEIPAELTTEEAILVEPLAVAVHAVRLAGISKNQNVLVVGGGPVGILCAFTAEAMGGSRPILTDLSASRLKVASGAELRTANADESKATVMEATNGTGAETVFECAGTPKSFEHALSMTGKEGQLVMISILKTSLDLDMFPIVKNQRVVRGSFLYTRDDFADAIRLMAESRGRLRGLITHRLPLEETQGGIDLVRQADSALKVLLSIDGEHHSSSTPSRPHED